VFRRLVFGLMVLLSAGAQAQPVSLAEAQRKALEVHPGLGRLKAKQEEARQKIREVEAGGNPHLEFQARYLFLTPELGFASPQGNLPIVVNHNYQAGLVLEQAVATFGRLHWAHQAAELQVKALEQDEVRERQRVAFQVALAYSRLQTARQSIGVAQESLLARERLLKDLALREKAGTSAHFETLVAEVAQAQDQQRLVQAEQQSQLAQSQLQVLLGLPRTQQLEVVPLSEAPPLTLQIDQVVQEALLRRAEMQAVDFAVQAAEARVHHEESQSNPTLGLQSRFDGRTQTSFQTGHQWAVGLEFRWPLFDGGLSDARAAQAESARVQLSEGRREIERQVRLEVEEALVRYTTAVKNLEVSQRNLKSAQEARRLGELRFKAGVGTHQEVLDVQARLREAQQGVFEAQQSLREACWQVQYSQGIDLTQY